MAVDMFLRCPEFKGETKDKASANAGAIDVLAWSWGMSNSGTFHTGGGGGAGKANFQDLSFTKYVDASSNALMLYAANGGHVPEATLVVRKAGDKPMEYITITMKKVLVTSLSTGGSGGEDRLTENVTFNFAAVEYEYKEQKDDGTAGAAKPFKWDIAGNVKL